MVTVAMTHSPTQPGWSEAFLWQCPGESPASGSHWLHRLSHPCPLLICSCFSCWPEELNTLAGTTATRCLALPQAPSECPVHASDQPLSSRNGEALQFQRMKTIIGSPMCPHPNSKSHEIRRVFGPTLTALEFHHGNPVVCCCRAAHR